VRKKSIKNSPQMTNFLVKLFPIPTMFCTLCYHRYLQHCNITSL